MSNEIKAALTALLANKRNRAITEDYLSARIADAKRMWARTVADDAFISNGKRTPTSAMSDRAYGTGHHVAYAECPCRACPRYHHG